jgi:gluconolactonase
MKLINLCLRCLVWLMVAPLIFAQDAAALLESGATVKKLAGGMAFVEGPVWIPTKKILVFSDIPNSKLMQWSESGGLSEFRQSENSNGNILDLEGRLISCQHSARNVIRTEADGKLTVLADKFEDKRFNSPNDVAVRSDGTLWFTDPPWGLNGPPDIKGNWVFKLNPSTGDVQPIIKDLAMPNGINFSPDETRLYVADTGGHPKHPDPSYHKKPAGVHCYEVSKDGTLGTKLFTIDHGSDGMAVDVLGNLYTTDENKIKIHDKDGKPIGEIVVPEGPANCSFGGDEYKTLFITARTSLYSIRLKNVGAKPIGAKW